jgi:hypothetical protein
MNPKIHALKNEPPTMKLKRTPETNETKMAITYE